MLTSSLSGRHYIAEMLEGQIGLGALGSRHNIHSWALNNDGLSPPDGALVSTDAPPGAGPWAVTPARP